MMRTPSPLPRDDSRLNELLLDRALQGLQADESAELRALMGGVEETSEPTFDPAGFEQAAALAAMALIGRSDVMPSSMRTKLTAAGTNFAGGIRTPIPRLVAPTSPEQAPVVTTHFPRPVPSVSTATMAASNRWHIWSGWLAAAACLALAAIAWLPRLASITSNSEQRSADSLRAQMLAQRPADLVQWSWSPGNDPQNPAVGGDIVWSDSQQRGYMRFTGLKPNDPSQTQYQLWIFDSQRKAEYPVDGGVFDVPADGEVVIAIDPKLHIFEANMFAVTVEKPGGVARSDRERIPALAQPPA